MRRTLLRTVREEVLELERAARGEPAYVALHETKKRLIHIAHLIVDSGTDKNFSRVCSCFRPS